MKRRPPGFGALPFCDDPPRFCLTHGRLSYWTGSGWGLYPHEALLYATRAAVLEDIEEIRRGIHGDPEPLQSPEL